MCIRLKSVLLALAYRDMSVVTLRLQSRLSARRMYRLRFFASASTVARRAVLTKYIPTGSTLHIGRVSIVCMYERTCAMLTILNVWEFYVGTHRVAVHV